MADPPGGSPDSRPPDMERRSFSLSPRSSAALRPRHAGTRSSSRSSAALRSRHAGTRSSSRSSSASRPRDTGTRSQSPPGSPMGQRSISLYPFAKLPNEASMCDATSQGMPMSKPTVVRKTHDLTEFHLFPRLVPELRLKIWNQMAHVPRIIEMTGGPAAFQNRVTVRKQSRLPPAAMQVNQEGRRELIRIYKLMHLDSLGNGVVMQNRPVYVNPRADIIYFGTRSIDDTLISFCQLQLDVPLRRMALSGGAFGYEWDSMAHIHFVDEQGHNASANPLAVLHGVPPPTSEDGRPLYPDTYPGWQGLQEIIWVDDRCKLNLDRLDSPIQYVEEVDLSNRAILCTSLFDTPEGRSIGVPKPRSSLQVSRVIEEMEAGPVAGFMFDKWRTRNTRPTISFCDPVEPRDYERVVSIADVELGDVTRRDAFWESVEKLPGIFFDALVAFRQVPEPAWLSDGSTAECWEVKLKLVASEDNLDKCYDWLKAICRRLPGLPLDEATSWEMWLSKQPDSQSTPQKMR